MNLLYTRKLLRDLIAFSRENKIWWMTPLIVVLLLAALLVVAGQGATPFIYTLF